MMEITDASIVVDTARPSDAYCIYEAHAQLEQDKPPEVIYVGATRLIDVYRLRDAKANSEFIKMFQNGGNVMIRIVATGTDRRELKRKAVARVHELNPTPRCNKFGYSVIGQQRPIKCSNGETYTSQKEAAEALGISQALISRHLAGDTTHARGYTFTHTSGKDA